MSEDEQARESTAMPSLWESALSTLEGRIKPHNFEMWLKPIQCKTVEGSTITLSAPSKWIKEWFQDNYQSIVLDALRAQTNQDFEILFRLPQHAVNGEAEHAAPVIGGDDDRYQRLGRWTFADDPDRGPGPGHVFKRPGGQG